MDDFEMIEEGRLRDRFRGCLVGLAVGDALGMPVEMMTREEIRVATGGCGIVGYLAPLQNQFHATAVLQPGQWTDDTQLALAIARSLVRQRGFDLDDIAAEHVVEYRKGRRGWGLSTEVGVQEIMEGKRKPGDPVLDPKALGLGNGVAMKIAPLALWTAMVPGMLSDERIDEHRDYLQHVVDINARIRELAGLTHRDACARIGAHLVAFAIHEALTWGSLFPGVDDDPSRVLGRVTIASDSDDCAIHGRALYRHWQRLQAHAMSATFARRSTIEDPLPTPNDLVAAARDARAKNSCSVLESVPFVCITAIDHFGSFRYGVLAAVNAGGDTDSNAAMVGAILGAYHGMSAIPDQWIHGLEAHDEIIALADQLFALACSRQR